MPVSAECSIRSVLAISVPVDRDRATLIRVVSSRSPSMMSSAPRPVMVSLPPPPRRMSPAPKTGPLTGQKPAAEFAMTVAALSVRGAHDRVQAGDAIHARLVDDVTAGEACAAERVRGVLVPPDDVVEARAGIGLGLLPAVAVDDHLDRHADEVVVDLHVVVGRLGVVLVEGPVEAGGAGVAVDRRVLGHQVVATLGVVVVLADLTDQDFVAGSDLRRVVEERRTVVALQEVLTGSAFDPVVATVAERRRRHPDRR